MGSTRLQLAVLLVSALILKPSVLRLTPNSYFPPPAPLLSYLLYPSHPFLTPFLHLIITLQTLYLTRHFQQLVKDRQYLTAEVMREYDQRFVYPKVFAMTSDKGVMTHEGNASLIHQRT